MKNRYNHEKNLQIHVVKKQMTLNNLRGIIIVRGRVEKMIKIYLDNCCYNRPFDDRTNIKNYLEREAVLIIMQMAYNGEFESSKSYRIRFGGE